MLQPKVNTQEASRRTSNFNEVSSGYSKKQAIDEARRCPQCANPTCLSGCPLGIDIPGFIRDIRENEPDRAIVKIKEQNMLASICGRLCPAPCEKACVFYEDGAPIGIRALERYAADFGQMKPVRMEKGKRTQKKVAIVGSGPAGLTAAAYLAQHDYDVTIFEVFDAIGGILRYGIPEFRLPKKSLDADLKMILSLGVKVQTRAFVGQTVLVEDLLKEGFQAILLSVGAGQPNLLNIPGTNLGGVYYSDEFLMKLNLFKADLSRPTTSLRIGFKVVVIGSGHSAFDCARSCLRLGRQVTLVLRRTEEDIHAFFQEKDYGKEEGLIIEAMTKPIEILNNENQFVQGVKCSRLDFADRDGSGHWQLMDVPDSTFILDADTVILAVGHQPNTHVLKKTPDLKVNPDGTIWSDVSGMSSIPGVFVAGAVGLGVNSLVQAMASGKNVAKQLDLYLTK